MFLNLLMPPAREGTCMEILDSLKSKRNDLTKRYFPVDENCKVLRHVSRSDRSFLIELVTWTIFILIGLLIWLSVDILASPCWCYKCVLSWEHFFLLALVVTLRILVEMLVFSPHFTDVSQELLQQLPPSPKNVFFGNKHLFPLRSSRMKRVGIQLVFLFSL